jgi:hypothetical protein
MDSATHAVPNEAFRHQISIDYNHSNMVKYDTPLDTKYVSVLVPLKECVKNCSEIPVFTAGSNPGVYTGSIC